MMCIFDKKSESFEFEARKLKINLLDAIEKGNSKWVEIS